MDIVTDPAMRSKRETFFKLVFGQNSGYVCIAFLRNKKFTEEFYRYPQDMEKMLDIVEANVRGFNIYFCPQLFINKKRTKENVGATPCAWSDLDTCNPENLHVLPTVTVESSPGRYQAYWVFGEDIDPDDAEDLSRRIAYTHANEGADRSGWDLTQLLRVPYTFNYKYSHEAEIPSVKIIDANRGLYMLEDFDLYPESLDYHKTDLPIPDEADLPLSADDLLQSKRQMINPLVWRYYTEEPENDWSKVLWNLQMLLYEAGFKRDEVYVIVREAKCNKYERDGKPAVLLWKEVCRAEAKFIDNQNLVGEIIAQDLSLLSAEEREQVKRQKDTFIERYITWASSLGDAAVQYHQAGAFVALSSLLSGSVRLPTSYGTVIPNLWFMILADTTLTRKTTAMDIAMDLVMEVDENVIMATDGSIEGLLTALASRPGRPSVFLRDEFTGLLEAMTKKDYMAGMPELFTKLYDGKFQKRILRKEIIEVRDPRLIFFAGGIKNKITGLLTFEHVSSGFMPRFIFITAESDITKLRPVGPPTDRTTGGKDALLNELQDIYHHYNRKQQLNVVKLKQTIETDMMFDVELTPEAWMRYNQLESDLVEIGLDSDIPDIMTPVGDRLAKSILKAAMLLSASRQRDVTVVVELGDILRAISYGEQWRLHAEEVMRSVGKGQAERFLETIYHAIERKEGGISRSHLMQAYHLTARDANMIFETLEQRGLISRTRSGRTEILVAYKKNRKVS